MSIGIQRGKMMSGGVMPGAGSIRQIPGYGSQQMGDPGFFGDLWGGIKGAVGGFVTGGPLGAIGGAIKGAIGERESVQSAAPRLPPMLSPAPTMVGGPLTRNFGVPQVPVPGVTGFVQRGFAGGATGYMDDPEAQRAGQASQTGYHWNKSGYFLKSGEWVAKGTRQVKNRRRNPLNPRALDRSISRITSAKRASKKLSRVTIRKASACK